jgi:hypothetical protein
MRVNFFLLALIFLQQIKAQIPTNNLVGHYKFNSNLNDNSINNNDITTGSGTFVEDRFGNPNKALSLNGTTDSLVLPVTEFSPILGDFAISFWYKTNSPEIMNLFSSKEFPSDTTNNFEVQLNSHNSYYLEYYKQSFFQTYVYWNGTGTNLNDAAEGTPGSFTKGDWCHFVLSREADTFKIYRNHYSYTMSANNFYGSTLGDAVDFIFSASPYKFKGSIDDLRLYNRSLNQAEVDFLWFEKHPFMFHQIKSTDAYVKGSNLLVYWDYDTSQVSDSILVEVSINGGAWTPVVHTNYAYECYTYLDLNQAPGTKFNVRVSDFSDTLFRNQMGEIVISEYDWVEVQDSLPFHSKDGAGLLNFNGKMWLLGGWDPPYHEPNYTHNEVWNSEDGSNWNFVNEAPWPARHCAAWISSDSAIWVIGGDPQSGCLTDVWKSEDGTNWILTNEEIPGFVKRNNPNYAFFNGKLTIYGGEQCSGPPLNDVWTSSDGVTWSQAQNAPWSGRGMQLNSCVDGNGNMWMLGGSNEGTRRAFNEVWKTSDGINWTLVNESAPWSGRFWHTVAWFDDKMWLMGGMATGTEMNDVWYSEDGITWKELKTTTGNWPYGSRHAQSSTVFDNALWYMCGINTNNAWKIINTTSTIGVHENQLLKYNLEIYPNPAKNELNIKSLKHENNYLILDLIGKIVQEGTTNGIINIQSLKKGMYVLKIAECESKLIVE